MKALTWQGAEKVEITEVPDPRIEQPTDAIVRVTSTAICGSDLHLYSVLGPFLSKGDVLGHEFMGIVEEVGPEASGHLKAGDRVVVPFNISCGRCFMCGIGKQSQCETTQVRAEDKGAALFGYTRLYGSVPGGQAEYVRVPQAHYGPVVLPQHGEDERYLYLSDILPTAWQAAKYGDITPDSTVAVFGLGPVGQLTARSAFEQGAGRVIGVDRVPERLELARRFGVETVNLDEVDPAEAITEMTQGRGADSVLETVGMEAHGSPIAEKMIDAVGLLPKAVARKATETMGIDRLAALTASIESVRRGGTLSVVGVYGGMADPMPMMTMFDKNLTIRMGQANVRTWTDELMEIVQRDGDVLGLETLATHRVPLERAPEMYDTFQKKQDGCIKVVLKP